MKGHFVEGHRLRIQVLLLQLIQQEKNEPELLKEILNSFFRMGQYLPNLSDTVTFYSAFPDSGFCSKLLLLLGIPPKAHSGLDHGDPLVSPVSHFIAILPALLGIPLTCLPVQQVSLWKSIYNTISWNKKQSTRFICLAVPSSRHGMWYHPKSEIHSWSSSFFSD